MEIVIKEEKEEKNEGFRETNNNFVKTKTRTIDYLNRKYSNDINAVV